MSKTKKSADEVNADDLAELIKQYKESVSKLHKLVYEDAQSEFGVKFKVSYGVDGDEQEKEIDFKTVRGDFETHSFVKEMNDELERQLRLADKALSKLEIISQIKK